MLLRLMPWFFLHVMLVALPCRAHDGTPTIEYELRFDNIHHHEADIRATFTGLEPNRSVELRMSRTSPGRYALHEFGKNVYDVRATDGEGRELRIEHPNPYQWNVSGHSGTVNVRYTLYGDRADGTYTGLDRTHAHLNMPSTIMWARNMDDVPIRIRFVKPHPEWTIATQLVPTDRTDEFMAPNLAYLLDSPTELAELEWYSWTLDDQGTPVEHRIALHHAGTRAEGEAFARSVERIVDAQYHVFGEMPGHDFGRYTFIVCYLPHVFGDGMEHRNSTVVTGTNPLTPDGLTNLGTMSHEYFHQWNVERIRPADLEPFDFEGENMTDLLWFAEGFTSYYTGLAIHRAGLSSVAEYAGSLSGTLNTVTHSPGRKHRSLADMSRYATYSDQGSFLDPLNTANTFISYYTWGSAVALGLDIVLRTEYNTSVDALMRAMWSEFGTTETPYTTADLERVLGQVAGDEAFARHFMDAYVRGQDIPDFEAVLARVGFRLLPEAPGEASLRATLAAHDRGVRVTGSVLEGSPLHEAGIANGDIITHVGEREVEHPAYIQALVHAASPGDDLDVTVVSRGKTFRTTVILGSDPSFQVIVDPNASDQAKRIRDAWLNP